MKLELKPGWATDVKLKGITRHDPTFGYNDGYVLTGRSFNNTIYMCPFVYEDEERANEVFWHEYRHVMHQREGMFSFYYTTKFRDVQKFITENPVKWIEMCLEVENDCDNYASTKTGRPISEPYPAHGVWLYNYAMKQMKKGLRRGTVCPEEASKYLTIEGFEDGTENTEGTA